MDDRFIGYDSIDDRINIANEFLNRLIIPVYVYKASVSAIPFFKTRICTRQLTVKETTIQSVASGRVLLTYYLLSE